MTRVQRKQNSTGYKKGHASVKCVVTFMFGTKSQGYL